MAQELYQLVIPKAVFETAVCRELLTVLQTEAFKKAIRELGGYETAETGNALWVG
jgi:molybdate-binding protein